MALRIFGVCLIVVGVALAIVSIRSLSDSSNMGRFMAEAGNAFSQPIDAQHWSERWRINAIGLAITAIGSVLAGLGIIARHRYAWAVLSFTLAVNVVWLLAGRGRGSREYAFEASSTQLMATAVVAVVCAWAAGRSGRRVPR
jgi:hypothetical protein